MTPLIKKLGLKEGSRACILEAPQPYLDLLGPLPGVVVLLDQPDDRLDFIQVFAKERRTLERQVSALKQHLAPAGMLWICGPRKPPPSKPTWPARSCAPSACTPG